MLVYYAIVSFFVFLFSGLASATRVALSLIRAALAVLPHSPRQALRILALGGIVRYRTWSFFSRTLLVDYWPAPNNDNFKGGRRLHLAVARAMVSFFTLHVVRYMSVQDIILVLEELSSQDFFEMLVRHAEGYAKAVPDAFLTGTEGLEKLEALFAFFSLLRKKTELGNEFSACLGRAVGRKGLVLHWKVDEASQKGCGCLNGKTRCWDGFGMDIDATTVRKRGLRRSKKGRN